MTKMSSDSEGRDGGGRERERERHTDRQADNKKGRLMLREC
jgi:hypothetical protein